MDATTKKPDANLVVHAGARYASRSAVEAVPAPEALGPRHRPIAHGVFLAMLGRALEYHGLTIATERYALGRDGAKLFGALTLSGRDAPDGMAWALGLRHGNDQSVAITLVAGARVFVCDNMALSGEAAVLRKRHTTGYTMSDLAAELTRGIGRYEEQRANFSVTWQRARNLRLDADQARARLFKLAVDEHALPLHGLGEAFRLFDAPRADETDCHGGSALALHNACTRVLRASSLAVQMRSAPALARVLEGR